MGRILSRRRGSGRRNPPERPCEEYVPMTLKEVYQEGKKTLTEAELESPAFDAISLFHKVFGMDRQALAIHGAADAGEVRQERYRALIRERAAGRPLQYILGSWPFMDLELEVGEGVLIPREETELLVYTGARRLAQAFPGMAGGKGLRAADLCAGTGAVALGLAGLLPQASVAALELEEEAFVYLQRNCRRMGRRVQPLRCDICRPSTAEHFGGLHGILSNPPYIRSAELPVLQREVRREPQSALDGGTDGLHFYRCIAALWVPRLVRGGVCAVETGEDQGRAVAALFEQSGLREVRVEKDFNGLDRVVSGIR